MTAHVTGGPALGLWWSDPWIDQEEAVELTRGKIAWTFDREAFRRADLVIVPIPSATSVPAHRPHDEQIWVLWSMESTEHYPALTDERITQRFDLRMTYRMDSDIPIPYFGPRTFDQMPEPLPLNDREPAPIAAFVSSNHDRCGRRRFLGELMAAMPVDSFGAVHRTVNLPGDQGEATKLATIRRYRFTAAFENSMTVDYVTEKFFQPLRAGSVPVVRGAPNLADFAPSPDCYVDATAFPTAAALADHLCSMSTADLERFHRWRHDGSIERWRQRWAHLDRHPLQRLADALPVLRLGRRAASRAERAAQQIGHERVERG